MTKKRLLLDVGLLASIACAALVGLAMLPRSRVTKANFEKIEIGMTRTEVEGIFGIEGEPSMFHHFIGADTDSRQWLGNDGSFVLITFRRDTVGAKGWEESNETVRKKLSRWFGWLTPRRIIDY
jgi:hypothetical protein